MAGTKNKMAIEVFNRCEKKYLIDGTQYGCLQEKIRTHMEYDAYNPSGEQYKICNIYYDTGQDTLIRHSIEKPVYKEKLRIRSYGSPKEQDMIFVELKKKYKGIVNKRRTAMPLSDAYAYLDGRLLKEEVLAKNSGINRQVLEEIDYFKQLYRMSPKLYLSYDRIAYWDKENPDFRLTFDCNITTRRKEVRLEAGSYGTQLLPRGIYLMELKVNQAVPLWFAKLMSELQIYPISFSKYGSEYKAMLRSQVAEAAGKEAQNEKQTGTREGEEGCLNQFLQIQQQRIPFISAHHYWESA